MMVYLIMKSIGEYSEREVIPIKVFTEENDAQDFILSADAEWDKLITEVNIYENSKEYKLIKDEITQIEAEENKLLHPSLDPLHINTKDPGDPAVILYKMDIINTPAFRTLQERIHDLYCKIWDAQYKLLVKIVAIDPPIVNGIGGEPYTYGDYINIEKYEPEYSIHKVELISHA